MINVKDLEDHLPISLGTIEALTFVIPYSIALYHVLPKEHNGILTWNGVLVIYSPLFIAMGLVGIIELKRMIVRAMVSFLLSTIGYTNNKI